MYTLLTYLFTYSTEQSPSWEANWFTASQEIPRILWNPKVHYLIYKCPPPVPILSQLDPVHNLTSHFLKIYLNIILPSTPGSPNGPFPSSFPTKTLYRPLLSPIRATCPYHLILFEFITRTIFGDVYISLNSPLCSFLHSPAVHITFCFVIHLRATEWLLEHPKPYLWPSALVTTVASSISLYWHIFVVSLFFDSDCTQSRSLNNFTLETFLTKLHLFALSRHYFTCQ